MYQKIFPLPLYTTFDNFFVKGKGFKCENEYFFVLKLYTVFSITNLFDATVELVGRIPPRMMISFLFTLHAKLLLSLRGSLTLSSVQMLSLMLYLSIELR